MALILANHFDHVIVSKPGSFKQSVPKEVFEHFTRLNPGTLLVEDPAEALHKACNLAGDRRPVLVTGSFYMVAEIRKLLPSP